MDNAVIDHLDLDAEKLYIRGTDLEAIIAERTFPDAVRLLLENSSLQDLDGFFKTCFRAYFGADGVRGDVISAARAVSDSTNTLIIALLLAWDRIKAALPADLDEEALGVALCSLVPCVLSDMERRDISFRPPEELYRGPAVKIVHFLVSEPGAECPAAFERVLVAMLGGFGAITPTIMAPRVAAGTGAGIEKCLVASLTAAGKYHVGACSQFMRFFRSLQGLAAGGAEAWLGSRLDKKEKIFGFGHPILNRDPRVALLKSYCVPDGDLALLELAERVMRERKDVGMNIDAIAGFVFLKSGVRESLGTPLFLYARSFAAVAHAAQKKGLQPFGNTKEERRRKFKDFPFKWI